MSPSIIDRAPPVRAILDRHFGHEELSHLLGTNDEMALSLARRATWAPLADLLSRPGKGLRARMVEHAFAVAREAVGASDGPDLPPDLPQVLELLHTGSLIVDDVEDDAELRRGVPAFHRVVGTPIAINAGNFLYFLPLLLLSQLGVDTATTHAMNDRVVRGLLRCHHGQGLDLSLRVPDLEPAQIRPAVELSTSLKTGALLELACALGAVAARAPVEIEGALTDFGREVGVALQMFDDLSGFIVSRRKNKGLEDLRSERVTWAWGWLSTVTDEATVRRLQREARNATMGVTTFDAVHSELGTLLHSVADRPRRRMDNAVAALHSHLGNLAAMTPLLTDLRALERGYV